MFQELLFEAAFITLKANFLKFLFMPLQLKMPEHIVFWLCIHSNVIMYVHTFVRDPVRLRLQFSLQF